jgi:hypothetical protein
MNLLAQSPSDATLSPSQLGTNVPQQLLRVYKTPVIVIHKGSNNSPGLVWVIWDRGIFGDCGFLVGPTNFFCNADKWKAGVYFIGKDVQ